MIYSAAQVVCCGRDDAEIARRAAAIGREPDELRAQRSGRLASRRSGTGSVSSPMPGAATMYLQVLDLNDLDHLELLAELID